MDKVKAILNGIRSFIFGGTIERKMQLGASLLMLIGGGALALAAAQPEDELIDITEAAQILESSDDDPDISEVESVIEDVEE